MNRAQYQKACDLADQALANLRKGTPTYGLLAELRAMLEPPPTMEEIVMKVPAEDHKRRAAAIGLSRTGYYNLMQGLAKPSMMVVYRLAELTGVDAETIKEVW